MEKYDLMYFYDMYICIKNIKEFIADSAYRDFADSKIVKSAVERQLIVLAISAKKLSIEAKEICCNIAWDDIDHILDKLLHVYTQKSQSRSIWNIVHKLLPSVLDELESFPEIDAYFKEA